MGSGIGCIWKFHGDGRMVEPGEMVRPGERINLPRKLGLGGQHAAPDRRGPAPER